MRVDYFKEQVVAAGKDELKDQTVAPSPHHLEQDSALLQSQQNDPSSNGTTVDGTLSNLSNYPYYKQEYLNSF